MAGDVHVQLTPENLSSIAPWLLMGRTGFEGLGGHFQSRVTKIRGSREEEGYFYLGVSCAR